jgi:hypothetical protein
MKRYLLSLLGAALIGTAYGQSPAPAPALAITTNPVVTAPAPCAPEPCATACPTACLKTKTVCVPEPTTVKKTKICFSSDCATVCSKGCSLFGKRGDCNSCKEGSCSHPHVERYLYKRVQTTVCDSHKCVPVQVAVCAPAKCAAPKCAAPCTPICAKGTCCNSAVTVAQQAFPTAPASAAANASNVEVLVIAPVSAATTR